MSDDKVSYAKPILQMCGLIVVWILVLLVILGPAIVLSFRLYDSGVTQHPFLVLAVVIVAWSLLGIFLPMLVPFRCPRCQTWALKADTWLCLSFRCKKCGAEKEYPWIST